MDKIEGHAILGIAHSDAEYAQILATSRCISRRKTGICPDSVQGLPVSSLINEDSYLLIGLEAQSHRILLSLLCFLGLC